MTIPAVDAVPLSLDSTHIHLILRHLDLLPPTQIDPPQLPSPPLAFLSQHLPQLPPSLAALFANVLSPQARARIPTIRNRRLAWALRSPSVLSAHSARDRHPLLYERVVGSDTAGLAPVVPARPSGVNDDDDGNDDEAAEEDDWGQNRAVLGGRAQHGNLGALLQAFEEERAGERRRDRKRQERQREAEETEEFDSESDDDDDDEADGGRGQAGGSDEDLGDGLVERIGVFERLVRERWIDGLESLPYDTIDFDETLDPPQHHSLAEDRWFADEEPDQPLPSTTDGPTSALAEGEYDY